MRITWLVDADVQQVGGQFTSPAASVRYRVLAPATELAAYGHQSRILRFDPAMPIETLDQYLASDVLVVSKVLTRGKYELVARAQTLGTRVVFDLCDDHFHTPQLEVTYRRLAAAADRLVASTSEMAAVIERETGLQAVVVSDPCEGPAGEACFSPDDSRLRLLWFGHPTNFDTLASIVPGLQQLARELPLDLEVISDPAGTRIEEALRSLDGGAGSNFTTRFTRWSPAATWQGLAACDLVLLPSLEGSRKQVKSPNRLVESLRAGRFVVAYPLPSYRCFADYVWLGEDVCDGVRWALAHRAAAEHRLLAGQRYVNQHCSAAALARLWDAVLAGVVERLPTTSAAAR
ncbi:MAG: hypothetical protein KF708_13705 [Pirellulales bacterium]|nr:hypothetical protein [Pirellulales bacterium]